MSESDYGRPLNELRDLFWSSPRLSLLPGRDADLQRAIFEAVTNRKLRVVGEDGAERAVTRPADIAVGSGALRLDPPRLADTIGPGEGGATAGRGERRPSPRPEEHAIKPRPAPTEPVNEVQVSFSLNLGLREEDRRQAMYDHLYGLAVQVDEGASHIQAIVKIVLTEAAVEEFKKLIAEAGATPSVTPIS